VSVGYIKNKKLLKKTALRIKELRETKGVTQEVFYNDTGINIGRIERAVSDISLSTLEKVCTYFDITIKDFFKKGFD
jgi:transcriptional regulator with XRE-family HTH domain